MSDSIPVILVTVQELDRLRRLEAAARQALAMVKRQKAAGDELLDDPAQVYVALGELQDAVMKCDLLADLLAQFDPEQHRRPPMLDDAPIGTETGAQSDGTFYPYRDPG
jgi:hypothetical protein